MQESAVQCCTALTWAWDLGSGSVGRSSYRFQKFQIWHVIFSLTVIERRDNVNARSFLCKGLWYAMNSPSKSTCSVAQEIAKEDKRRYYLRVCIVCMIFRYFCIYIYIYARPPPKKPTFSHCDEGDRATETCACNFTC